MNWLAVLLFAGSAQCLLLGALILVIKAGDRRANIFLSIFFGLMAIRLLLRFVLYAGYPLYPPLYGLNIPTMMLAPMLYLYVVALTDLQFRVTAKLAWHSLAMLPGLLYFGYAFHLYGIAPQVSGLDVHKQVNLSIHVAAVLVNLVYGGLALHNLARHRLIIEQVYSRIEDISLTWLLWLVWIYIAVVLLHFTAVLLSSIGLLGYEPRTWVFLVTSLLIVYVVSLGGLRQPLVFTRSVRELMADIQQAGPPEAEAAPQVAPGGCTAPREDAATDAARLKKSGLDDVQIQATWERLHQVMEEDQPYLDNELNLAELATLTAITASQLSRVINARAGVNFYEFVNGYRIDAARKLLTDPTTSEQNMLDTAMAVGFNSQSTFYSHFRKRVGMTPKQFQNRHKG